MPSAPSFNILVHLQTAQGKGEQLVIYVDGDGELTRDFVFNSCPRCLARPRHEVPAD